jgi:methionyl-tRNA formyltransferase
LLPKYRGPAPIQWAIINGEEKTGVCTMAMAPGVDTGDILISRETAITPEDTAATLHDRLALMGADILMQTLDGLAGGKITPKPQDHARATHAPMLKKDDGHIPWEKSSREIYNFIRGMTPWPGAFTFHNGKRLKIFSALILPAPVIELPGTVMEGFTGELRVATGEGALSILEIQGESGKRIPVGDFLRGHAIAAGDSFN